MLGQRITNDYGHGGDGVPFDPSREVARVFLSNRAGEVVIYTTEGGHLSFGLRSPDEDERDEIIRQ